MPNQPTDINPDELDPETRDFYYRVREFISQLDPCPDCNCRHIISHSVDHDLRLVRCEYCSHVFWSAT